MNLKNYYGKHVIITTYKGRVFTGSVDDYFYPEDNEDGLESIGLTTSDGAYEFNKNSIESIKINKIKQQK